jgi:hypothetical protein
MDCGFIKYAYNSSGCWFFIHKSSIKNINSNAIMELRNAILFEDMFLWKEIQENRSLKRTIEASSSNHH